MDTIGCKDAARYFTDDSPSIFEIMEIPRRYFVHGDVCERTGEIYCGRCDLFVDDERHEHWLLTDDRINRAAYRKGLATVKEFRALPNWGWAERWFRPRNAPNIFKGD